MRAFEQRKKNSSTSSNFFGPKIQKKIKTGTVGDKYEVEADKVADKVVNNSSGGGLLQSKKEEEIQQKPISETISSVQKQEMKEEEPVQKKEKEEEPVQKKEEEESVQKKEEDETVQKKSDKTEVDNNQLESKLNYSKGKGSQLNATTRQEMENGFGTDFSKVKIHTDSNAVQMNTELGAQAFTNGNDIYFNNGKYNPNSKEGKHLLAHELTHTVQQSGRNKIQIQSRPQRTPRQVTRRRTPITAGDFMHQLNGSFITNQGTPSELIITSRDTRESFTGCNAFEVVVDGVFKRTVNSRAKKEPITTTIINISDLRRGRHRVSLTIPPDCNGPIHANIFVR